MLSRVVKSSAAEAKPVAFRVDVPVPKPGVRRPEKRSEADELRMQIAELKKQAEQQVRQALEQGRREGESAARQAMDAELKTRIARVAEAVAEISGLRSETIHRAEADTVRLALAITRRVLHQESSINSSILGNLIQAALEKLQGQEVYRVRVHPDQEQVMKECLEKAGRGQTVTVVPDPTQSEGGAVFETNRGLLDASLDTQLDEIERLLADLTEARS